MRPIDADALIKEYEEIAKALADFCEMERMMCREVIRALQNAPTIDVNKLQTPAEPSEVDFRTDKSANIDTKVNDLISREDAIAYIDRVTNSGLGKNKSLEYIRKYISALPSTEPNIDNGEVSVSDMAGDLISRADAVDVIDELDWYHVNKKGEMVHGAASETDAWYKAEDIYKALNELPSADRPQVAYICDGRKCDKDCSECFKTLDIEHARDFKRLGDTYYQQGKADRPQGEWLYLETEPYSRCSACGAYIDDLDDDKYKYCPYCGAKMK